MPSPERTNIAASGTSLVSRILRPRPWFYQFRARNFVFVASKDGWKVHHKAKNKSMPIKE
ncbi:hypothetical protein ES703_69096 [subsurface metagenome]